MDYQKTLNLPQTDFAMKANLAQKEPVLLEKWEGDGLYAKIKAQSKGKKPFLLHDGPPYANGHIHIGHALNKILKDIIVKFRTMQGYDSYYLPGWDCHGLPIEHQLLKELKKHKSEVDGVDFRKKAHDYAMKFVGIQREEFKRLGIFGEWDHPYLTLTPEYEYWILKSLAELNQKGYITRGLKPVNWCPVCETALAEAEVEYEDHTSPSVYVKFEVNNSEILALPKGKKVFLLIWTTTPWTLLANVAVAVNPEFTYVAVDLGKEILILEESLAARILEKQKLNFEILKRFQGKELGKLTYQNIFDPQRKNCPVVFADYVTKEDGTGLVHTAPGHGQEDFETGLKYKLDVVMPVNERGIFTKEGAPFEGEHVFKANEKIILELEKRGILFAQENIPHSYPHCWRCKKPIIFRATKQWFLRIDHDNLRDRLIESIKKDVQWIPPSGQERILGMVTTRPDWCLSRQRFWGVPIPALVCKKCGEHHLDTEVIERFGEIVRKSGSDVWFEKDVKEFIPKEINCSCGSKDFDKGKDILDVWFDSGVSHQAVLKGILKRELPAEMYLEGSDQHRGWFQSSLIPAVAIEGKAPFKAVLTHGFVVDAQGRKMSKSLGNVVAPQDIIKTSGADILRLWVASSSTSEDIRISKEILDRLVDSYRKIRNTFRYLLGNVYDFNPEQDMVAYNQLLELDQWALNRLVVVLEETRSSFEKYDFSNCYKLIYNFCNEDLSSFYLDILKDRLYTSAAKSLGRRCAQTVLYQILNHLVGVLAPLLSFTAEEIYLAMPKEMAFKDVQSVHLLAWLDIPQEWKNNAIEEKFATLKILRPYVLKALEEKRRQGEIGGSLEAKVIFKTASDRDLEYLEARRDILSSIFIVSGTEVCRHHDVPEGLSEEFPKTTIEIKRADGNKCVRCWNYKIDVGLNTEHLSLCGRCVAIVKELT